MNDDSKIPQPDSPQRCWIARSLFMPAAGIAGMITAFTGGLYLETGIIEEFNPFTEYLRYHLGMIMYCLVAFFFILVSASMVYKSRKSGHWNELQRDLFYAMVFMAIIFLMTGFEFLFWMDWQYVNPVPFLLIKGAFTGLLAVFTVRIIRIRWLE